MIETIGGRYGTVRIDGGILQGEGTIDSDVVIAGGRHISHLGTMTITGNYRVAGGGAFVTEKLFGDSPATSFGFLSRRSP